MRIWHVAVLATVGGILLHACIVLLAFSDEGGAIVEPTPRIVVTAAVQPSATPEPTALPDRTSCEEIRGTEYRSDAEREFFRASCITPVP